MKTLMTASILLSLATAAHADIVTVDDSVVDRSRVASTTNVRDPAGNTYVSRANTASCFTQQHRVRFDPSALVPSFEVFLHRVNEVDSATRSQSHAVMDGVVESRTYDATYSTKTSFTMRVVPVRRR
jgi:hypothetical protein